MAGLDVSEPADVAVDGAPRGGDRREVRWHAAYRRDAVERFLAAAETHAARLRAEIDAARARAAAARRVTAERRDESGDLAGLLHDARHELEAIEQEHRELLRSIADAAAHEATRIVTAARAEADAVRLAAASLTSRVGASDATPRRSGPVRAVGERNDDR